jgi:hypothetical protein
MHSDAELTGDYPADAPSQPEPDCQHTETKVEGAVEATCGQPGHTGKTVCVDCGEVISEEVVPALGHSHKAVVTAPTCAKPGYTTYTCVCGDSYTADETPATENHISANGVCTGCRMPQLRFYGANLSLQTNLAIGYVIPKAQVDAYDSVYVKCVMNGYVTDVVEYDEVNGSCYFYFRGLSPMIIGDTVVAQIYGIKDGVEYRSAERPYSILEYCQNTLNKSNVKTLLGTMLVDLLNYGTALQNYMGYKTDAPVNGVLTETQKSWGTVTDRTLETMLNAKYEVIENAQASWRGAGLTLGEVVAIQYMIVVNPGVDVNRLSLRVRMESGAETEITGDQFVHTGGGVYAILFDKMTATQMSEAIYATVCMDGVPVSNTARYSVESYAYNNQNAANSNLAKLVKAMIRYGDSAKAYVEASK